MKLTMNLKDDFLQRTQWALNHAEPGFRALREQRAMVATSASIAEEETAYISDFTTDSRELLNIGTVRSPGLIQIAGLVEPLVRGFFQARHKVLFSLRSIIPSN